MGKKEQAQRDNEVAVKFLVIIVTAIIAIVGFAIANIETLSTRQIYLGTGATACLVVLLIIAARVYWATRKRL